MSAITVFYLKTPVKKTHKACTNNVSKNVGPHKDAKSFGARHPLCTGFVHISPLDFRNKLVRTRLPHKVHIMTCRGPLRPAARMPLVGVFLVSVGVRSMSRVSDETSGLTSFRSAGGAALAVARSVGTKRGSGV